MFKLKQWNIVKLSRLMENSHKLLIAPNGQYKCSWHIEWTEWLPIPRLQQIFHCLNSNEESFLANLFKYNAIKWSQFRLIDSTCINSSESFFASENHVNCAVFDKIGFVSLFAKQMRELLSARWTIEGVVQRRVWSLNRSSLKQISIRSLNSNANHRKEKLHTEVRIYLAFILI